MMLFLMLSMLGLGTLPLLVIYVVRVSKLLMGTRNSCARIRGY